MIKENTIKAYIRLIINILNPMIQSALPKYVHREEYKVWNLSIL
jgi:hypothetical protein